MIKVLITFLFSFTFFFLSGQQADQQMIESKIEKIVSSMSLQEKIGQTNLRGTSSRVKGALSQELKDMVIEGRVGAFLNVIQPEYVQELQHLAIDESKHGIPLLFARDIIHGFKTIFPIPLGQAASWDREVAYNSARVSAIEASAQGIRWTFAPMLDIARDSRWGRIAESPGEDPFLASLIAKASVEGFHGEGLSDPTSIAACAKHFIGYGAAEGGRDYNTVIIHEPLLRNVYLPPFQAALKAGAPTVMTSFNEINGVPVSGSKFLLDQVLRKENGFDGFVVSDWNSIIELISHGFAADEKQAAELAANAGLDMEMASRAYELHLEELIKEGKVSEEQLDSLVKNILRVKLKMGMFDHPYVKPGQEAQFYSVDHLAKAKDAAIKSSVLLKNDLLLPLQKKSKIALIGPLAHAGREQLGTWSFDGDGTKSQTPKMALEQSSFEINYAPGLSYSRDKSREGFDEAISSANQSDVIVFVGGEEAILSGEAHSRADIRLPGRQEELLDSLAKTGKPIVLVIMAGRPINIQSILDKVDAILMMWHPGTMGGPALREMLSGDVEPGGRLPVTWPKSGAQCPIYYNHKNTGRPANAHSFVPIDSIPVGAWQSSLGNESHYLDLGFTPQFPFGYGLGYSSFSYSELSINKPTLKNGETQRIAVQLKNTGTRRSTETVQLYVQDVVGSITRPVKELKGFTKITLDPGGSTIVLFELNTESLTFFNSTNEKVLEAGSFNVWVGPNSTEGLSGSFALIED
jgi:beta-glucosidase